MPITYRVEVELRFVEARYTDRITIQDVRDAATRFTQDPSIAPDFKLLSIFDGAQFDISRQDFRDYEKFRKQLRLFPKIAIVAPSDLEYGVARQFMSATEGVGAREMNVFRNLKDARTWLGLPEA